MKTALLIALTASFAAATLPALAQGNSTVRCPVEVDIPQVVMLTGPDLVTTTQNLTLNASNITFDSNLTARGKTSVTWRGNSNGNSGFIVTVQRSVITGTGSSALQRDLTVAGTPTAGGDIDVEILGGYNSGVSIDKIPEGVAEQFCKTSKPGAANFNVDLKLDAPSQHGRGTLNTVLTFIGAAI